MSIYKIKDQVPEAELEKLTDFLRKAWKPDHALLKSKALLDWQHYDKKNKAYNFIVAENQLTGEYDALEGYIPTAQFDESLRENGDYWGAIWKRRDDVENDEINLIGAEIHMRFFSLPYFHSRSGISLSKYAVKASQALKYKFGFMHQYYIINKKCSAFKIADHVTEADYTNPSSNKEAGWRVRWIDLDERCVQDVQPAYRPYKSLEFIKNRYLKHPIYQYQFLGLFKDSEIKAILVTRTNEVDGARVLRIVDTLGTLGGYVYDSFQEILEEGHYEYVDFLNYGIDAEVFQNMGFLELDFDSDALILPNYYEPFERRNVKMTVVHKEKTVADRERYDSFVAFKGDADQDRPNVL